MHATRTITCLFLLLPATLPGCGRTSTNQGDVLGTVTLDGKPVERGTIAFLPIEDTKGAATAGPIESGRYEIVGPHGPAVGWNRVEIHAPHKTDRMIPYGFGGSGKMIEEETEAVPPQFNIDSTLKIEITPGDNRCDFEVSAK